MLIPSKDLEKVDPEDVSTHIYDIYVDSSPVESQDLGIYQRGNKLQLSILDNDFDIEQSLSSLNGASSSTGFVLWKVSIAFVKWLLESGLYNLRDGVVVELGAGVTGLFACLIGPETKQYIATDQRHLLKLLKRNIDNNFPREFTSSTLENGTTLQDSHRDHIGQRKIPQIDTCAYDWEAPEQDIDHIRDLTGGKDPDFVVGCDIVYNDYLVEPLVKAIEILAGPNTIVLIGLQLRLPENIELFVEELLRHGFKVFRHPQSVLSEELRQGYVVYYIEKACNNLQT